LADFARSIRVMLIPPDVEEGISVINHGGKVLVLIYWR
jgi:hypothetical protein